MYKVIRLIYFLTAILFFTPYLAGATDYTSSSFKVLDPVISSGGGFSSSGTFQMQGSLGQAAIGLSNSGTFEVKGGFLYFPGPVVPTPTPTPTPTATQSGGQATPPVGGGPPSYITLIPKPGIGIPELPVPIKICGVADFNCDGVVDIIDLSDYLYLTTYAPKGNPADLNGDGVINFTDTSVFFYYWSAHSQGNLADFAKVSFLPAPISSGFAAAGSGNLFVEHGKKPPPKSGNQNEGPLRSAGGVAVSIFAQIGRLFTRAASLCTSFLRFLISVVKLK